MTDLELARHTLDAERLAFAVARDGKILRKGTESGAVELLAALDHLGVAARGACLADKVVGKAVALMAAHAGIAAIDATLASQTALDFCLKHEVALRARATVPVILNRRGDGPCPMEKLSMGFDDAATGVAKLREFFAIRDGLPVT